jgi:hypothetical protein
MYLSLRSEPLRDSASCARIMRLGTQVGLPPHHAKSARVEDPGLAALK